VSTDGEGQNHCPHGGEPYQEVQKAGAVSEKIEKDEDI